MRANIITEILDKPTEWEWIWGGPESNATDFRDLVAEMMTLGSGTFQAVFSIPAPSGRTITLGDLFDAYGNDASRFFDDMTADAVEALDILHNYHYQDSYYKASGGLEGAQLYHNPGLLKEVLETLADDVEIISFAYLVQIEMFRGSLGTAKSTMDDDGVYLGDLAFYSMPMVALPEGSGLGDRVPLLESAKSFDFGLDVASIFSSVVDIADKVHTYMSKEVKPPHGYGFSGAGTSRQKLYRILAKKLSDKYGYKYVGEDYDAALSLAKELLAQKARAGDEEARHNHMVLTELLQGFQLLEIPGTDEREKHMLYAIVREDLLPT